MMAQVIDARAEAGDYIVKYKKYSNLAAHAKSLSKISMGVQVKAIHSGTQAMRVQIDSESARQNLLADPDVEYIEPNYILSVDPNVVSGLGAAPQASDSYSQSGTRAQVRESWDIQKAYNVGSKVVVAIIDTGLDRNHLLFKDSGGIWENTAEKNGTTGVDDDGNGYIDDINGWNFISRNGNVTDDNGHGTHCAGIVLGVGQDVTAMPVRESKVQIMTLKFLDSSGAGTTSDAISAIEYAVAKGAQVINNSWGGPNFSQSLSDAYVFAYNRGVLIVTASGNSNTNNDVNAMYPANINTPGNISVLATTDSDFKASFSNFGASKVHVGAPGVNIISSVPGTGCSNPGCFQMLSGTSMAAPFVAGMAALILREASQLTPYQVKNVITGTVDTSAGLSGYLKTNGRVNVYKAIAEAKNQISTTPVTPPVDSAVSTRSPASTSAGAAPAGCGLVKVLVDHLDEPPTPPPVTQQLTMILLLFMPLMLALRLRKIQSITLK